MGYQRCMAYYVTDACIRCKYTDCVTPCPVDCFHEGENMLVIDPEECIDCGACVSECPVSAIYAPDDLPAEHDQYIELNARLSREWPVLHNRRPALPEAEEFSEVKGKRAMLSEKAGAGN